MGMVFQAKHENEKANLKRERKKEDTRSSKNEGMRRKE